MTIKYVNKKKKYDKEFEIDTELSSKNFIIGVNIKGMPLNAKIAL